MTTDYVSGSLSPGEYLQRLISPHKFEDSWSELISAVSEKCRYPLVRFLYRSLQHRPNRYQELTLFFEAMGNSSANPEEWTRAVLAGDRWLAENKQVISLVDLVGYLSCCEEMEGASAMPLPYVLTDCLSRFGLARAKTSCESSPA